MTDSPTGDSPAHLVVESSGPETVAPENPAAAPRPAGPDGGDNRDENGSDGNGDAEAQAARRRRRGSRGGRNRTGRPRTAAESGDDDGGDDGDGATIAHDRARQREPRPRSTTIDHHGHVAASVASDQPDLPDPPGEGRVTDLIVAAEALVRRPKIGDSRPAPGAAATAVAGRSDADDPGEPRKRRRGGRGKGKGGPGDGRAGDGGPGDGRATDDAGANRPSRSATVRTAGAAAPRDRGERTERSRSGRGDGSGDGRQARTKGGRPVEAIVSGAPIELDAETMERRRGRERNGKPVGRYLMCVHKRDELTQIAVLEGRSLLEHFVSRPADDVSQIHGNVYLGRVQNVLPGMEAAFIDIATPKNAVLYRGDVAYDAEDIESRGKGSELRIEQMLKARQLIMCQVTKNPIGAKGARLTQEVSLPGRFVVLIPNSKTYGISKRLPDDERKRLRAILDRVKPAEHGVIVRTAAENVVAEELRADVERLLRQWRQIEALAAKANGPKLLYREPDLAVRVIREEFNAEHRGVIIDDRELYEEVRDYVGALNPALVDRIEYYDPDVEGLPLFERHHVHEQLHKSLDRKVWLPSGGSLIIEHTEALTVIDVNTGKNVGTTNLEETVFRNNLEAATEIARQLRLRDIGGIIVIDFIDMEIKENRHKVVGAFRDALSRDKTRSQVFDISELGLVEMTRKRIGEGLLTAFASPCPMCDGRGVVVNHQLID